LHGGLSETGGPERRRARLDNGDPFPPRLIVKGAADVKEGVRSVEEFACAIATARTTRRLTAWFIFLW